MPMNGAYLDAIAMHASSLITHIGLVDDVGTELSSASYSRQAVTWTGPSGGDGEIRPDSDIEFSVESGDTVAGWRAYSASSGGTDYGGDSLTQVDFSNDGTYTLLAASTSIDHNAS